jgi:hypothetical protein
MSRNVIIKALLPHRDIISTMLVSPRISRSGLYISQRKKCMPQVSKQGKNSHFSLCYVLNDGTAIVRGIFRADEAANTAQVSSMLRSAAA